jgi:two-component system, chemotaxis family, protein-glutamate methylesterase/glutaminase
MSAAQKPPHIRVLVVDDSQVERELLSYLLNADPRLQVAGTAADGEQAIRAAQRLRPDVILMDIHLPKLNGFAATRRIMETCPTRIVMVTTVATPAEVAASFDTLGAGALTVLAKPPGPGHARHRAAADELLRTVKLMAEMPVVRRWARTPLPVGTPALAMPTAAAIPATPAVGPAPLPQVRLVALGASTGGPLVLQTILSLLPRDFRVPVAIVQHIPIGFAAGFIEWLQRTSGYPVRVPYHGEAMLAGTAYFAPDDTHMLVRANGTIALSRAAVEHGMRPAVSTLFRSVVTEYGPHAAGVLLTGMGRDGALELLQMRQAGAVTLVQDRETAAVYGMPGEALRLDAASYVVSPPEIAATLDWIVARHRALPAKPEAKQ